MFDRLFDIQKILLDQFEPHFFYDREIFNKIRRGNRVAGIVGARGVGKTTFLLKQVAFSNEKKRQALYVSADNIFFLDHRLFDLVDYLYKETDVRLLCIDEIHKYSNWCQELKNIIDTFAEFKLFFSGSSAIDLLQSKFDLSRRVILYELHGFSFREFLEFTHGKYLAKVNLEALISSHVSMAHALDIPQILKYFNEYLKVGYYPFFKMLAGEYERFQAIENVIQKTIYEDIGTLHLLKTPTLSIIEKIFKYVLQSSPGELSVYKLASTLGKDFENVSGYLELLKQAGLIRSLYPNKTGKAFLRNPIKIYPENTNMIFSSFVPQMQDVVIGKLRETFIVNQLQNAGYAVYYSEIGDFKVNEYLLEVGGKNKTKRQIKQEKNAYVVSDGILMGSKQVIPLYLFGLLY